MPLLGALFSNLIVGFGTFLAGYIGARAALVLTAIATITTMTLGLAVVIQALVATVIYALPTLNPIVQSMIWVALPSNVGICVGACLSADAFVAVYLWGRSYVNLAVKA